jgi:hypothetical protein
MQVLLDSAKGALQASHTSAYWHAAQLVMELGLLRAAPAGRGQRGAGSCGARAATAPSTLLRLAPLAPSGGSTYSACR